MAISKVEDVKALVAEFVSAGVEITKVLQSKRFVQLLVDEEGFEKLPSRIKSKLRAGVHEGTFCVYVHHEQVLNLFAPPPARKGRMEKVRIQGRVHEQLVVDVRVPGVYEYGQFTLENNPKGGGTVPYDG